MTTTTTTTDAPRIYVASLTDYNGGILHGRWVDLSDCSDTVWGEIQAMLAESPYAKRWGETAEEWAIHDYEGFGTYRVSEWSDIDRLVEVAEVIEEHNDAGRAFVSIVGEYGFELSEFEDRYRGEWSSWQQFAEQLFDDIYYESVEIADRTPYVSVNYEMFARDLRCDEYHEVELNGSSFVFETG